MVTRIDRERVVRITAEIEECYRKAEAATTPDARARYVRAARGFERTRRYYRTFPLGIWLISASAAAILMPWALLSYYGVPWLGVILSAVVALPVVALPVVALADFAAYRRRRRS